ncbi:uncharacterized protein LOC108411816 isoform X7 [Pygocentrus nattereri]|uniref:uncharacterized protein LOC108411816 isoform X7 n=1 Tax=Pygocentrus nattereri TaxID=42514 RepID=UPI001891BD62|nr:uncharacterized protein LOC108411816 isoform X7 [Pygocentrus nattereri]
MIRLMCKTGATFIQKNSIGQLGARAEQEWCNKTSDVQGRPFSPWEHSAIVCHRPLPYNKSLLSGQYLTRPHIAFRIQDKANMFYHMHLHHNNGKQGGTCPIRIHGHLRIQDKARMFLLIQMVQVEEEMNVFPLNSVETLEDLEKRLLNNGLKQRMTNTLSLSGGHTMKKTIWRIASKVFTTNLAKSLNWCGRGHKRGLKQTACGQLIIAAAGKNPTLPAPTEAEAEKCLKDYLRLAPARR